jgi:hypothetical protein
MMDSEELAEWSTHTPTTLDYLSQYSHGLDRMEYVICQTANADGTKLRPGIFLPASAEAFPADDAFFRKAQSKIHIIPKQCLIFRYE